MKSVFLISATWLVLETELKSNNAMEKLLNVGIKELQGTIGYLTTPNNERRNFNSQFIISVKITL